MYSLCCKWSAFILLAVVLASFLHGQTTATEILGLVKDSSGAIISGAQITITRIATGTRITKTTNQAGEYTFPLIDIGMYSVRVEMQGFRSQTVTDLRVETQQKARVDFVLEVGNVTETVEVVASSAAQGGCLRSLYECCSPTQFLQAFKVATLRKL